MMGDDRIQGTHNRILIKFLFNSIPLTNLPLGNFNVD